MKTKIALATALVCGSIGPAALADSMSGTYVVQSCSSGAVLQVGTTEKIEADASSFVQSLDMEGQQGPGSPQFSPLLIATIGEVITRPTPDVVALGYTTVDRQIASYNANADEFVFKDYRYDMSLTDAQGLAAGPYKTVTIKAQPRGLAYELKFSDGEEYQCVLLRQ